MKLWPRRCAKRGIDVRTATLDEADHGLGARCARSDRCAALVGPPGARRGAGRGGRAHSRAGARWHGADRAALGALLQDLQAPDGHERRSEVASCRRARAALGGGARTSDRGGPAGAHRARAGRDVRRALRHPAAGRAGADQLVSGRRGVPQRLLLPARGRPHLLFSAGPRDVPHVPRPGHPAGIANAVRWAAPGEPLRPRRGRSDALEQIGE